MIGWLMDLIGLVMRLVFSRDVCEEEMRSVGMTRGGNDPIIGATSTFPLNGKKTHLSGHG